MTARAGPAQAVADAQFLQWVLVAMSGAFLAVSVVILILVLAPRRGGGPPAAAPRARRGGAARAPQDQPPAPVAPPRPAFLRDCEGITGRERLPISYTVMVVGRSKTVQAGEHRLLVQKPTVGRRHALIEYRNHCFWITDQRSVNGTFVNDTKLRLQPVMLQPGDRIRFHEYEFEFCLAGEENQDAAVAAEPPGVGREPTVMPSPAPRTHAATSPPVTPPAPAPADDGAQTSQAADFPHRRPSPAR